METNIQVEKWAESEFRVTLTEGRSRSSYVVTVPHDYYEKLTGGQISAEELVRQSFQFLLEREPKESILNQFDLRVIATYFPEYEREIKRRLEE